MPANLSQVKLSNVIGAPFDEFVLEQMYLRAIKNSKLNRSSEEVLFIANKTAWVRLISSVNIVIPEVGSTPSVNQTATTAPTSNIPQASLNTPIDKYIANLGLDPTPYPNPESLAKKWVLEAGTSRASGDGIVLRSGIGPNGAYGLGGTAELGYRPMPGLTGVTIETAGRLGSLRYANISFKVWNLTQLNVVEALYFRLGYTMLLEWGHTQFYKNPSINPSNRLETATNTYGIDNPFASNLTIPVLQQTIFDKKYQLSGNYDGMVGVVTSFNWSLNQEGGYDCSVKLIGKGAIIESLRINQSYKMPDGDLAKVAEQYSQKYEDFLQEEKERLEKEKQDRIVQAKKKLDDEAAAAGRPSSVPKNLRELQTFAYKVDEVDQSYEDFIENDDYWWYTAYNLDGLNNVPDWFYVSITEEYNKKWVGLFLQKGNTSKPWQVLHNAPQNSRFALDNAFLEKFTQKDLQVNYNINAGPQIRNKIYAIKDVQNLFAKLFEYRATEVDVTTVQEYSSNTRISYYGPDTPLTANIKATTRLDGIRVQYIEGVEKRSFYFTLTYKGVTDPNSKNYIPTKQQVCTALDQWLTQNAPTVLTSIETVGLITKELKITGRATLPITTPVVNIVNKTQRNDINVLFEITFNNTSFIGEVLPSLDEQIEAAAQQVEAINNGDTNGAVNNATNSQTTPPEALESSLHVMLTAIKNAAEVKGGTTANAVVKIPLVGSDPGAAGDLTPAFFQAGVFRDVLTAAQETNPNGVPYDLVKYAQKGFNSYLMVNPALYDKTPFVNFNELSVAYLVKYLYSNENEVPSTTNYPVYIKFGYLLALLNNLCLIYDSDKPPGSDSSNGAKKEPYIFIDFNPETNYCLTSPQQLSVDPKVCLIPFTGTDSDYEKIFPINGILTQPPFKPSTQDYLSYTIRDFKTNNQYQGKTMNILLNVDYLLGKINNFASSDAEHGVYLQPFLNALVEDVNKSLGNQNKFRIAYRDDSNTVQIVDDQFVPPGIVNNRESVTEPDILNRNVYKNTPAKLPEGGAAIFGKPRYGQIPILGLQGLVRNVQFKTNLSTKLASLIAISAQSTTASINSTDPTSLSHLNQNFQDRYKPYVDNGGSTPNNVAASNTATTASSNDSKVADEFNAQVLSIYALTGSIDTNRTETAKNYLIERIATTKAGDPVTSAAPFIPADLEITVDGISGIVMGNAFTIPEDRLPNSLRGSDGFTKVGFIVTGLTHTIQDNQWLTKIKGQMIKLREQSNYSQVGALNTSTATAVTDNTPAPAPKVENTTKDLSETWLNVAFPFIASKEGFIARAKWDVNHYRGGYGSDVIVLPDNTVKTVTSTTVFSREDAERTLKYQLIRFKNGVINQISQSKWDGLNDNQKAALVSYAYNAGPGALSTWRIKKAIQTNASATQVAQFIQAGPVTAKGVRLEGLVVRRREEARLYLS